VLSCSVVVQSYGAGNVASINPTSTMIIGPINISVPVRNGSTEALCELQQPAS
jgi:hypothetical protein